ncbi:HD domain-containing protein [Pedobacter punctiformis]|uniref:HD domain-containing protein n=1 Tax=Pedobacter punctiformis TaxID=3004097 RepID=A0ABT4L835_9SPHI|nr:HD domain-containing protein [Pedobacter sp. HCMS5-2]MCZ4244087.1 HD domain-containing protein [Pedobacter sp. HCMS5-2]
MEIPQEILLEKVRWFTENLLKTNLPDSMYFHNYKHTLLVVEGVTLIGKATGLSDNDQFILTVAAFLHDVGYTQKYIGHELSSANIAETFLLENGLEPEKVMQVKACIMATSYPQFPSNTLEMIICDADFYHFALKDYLLYAHRLKQEWEEKLGLIYSGRQWDALNLEMLARHEYFTAYGKQFLQPKKNLNIEKLIQRFT